jgi:c-di-GMP-binding flagellar brake protein YcgR
VTARWQMQSGVTQRREHVRVPSRLPIRVQRLLAGGEPTGPLDTFVIDISGGGLRIAGPDVLRVGDRIRFELALPEGRERLEGRARVARRATDGTHGLEIDDVPEGRRDRIVRHVFERQRELLEERRAESDNEAVGA